MSDVLKTFDFQAHRHFYLLNSKDTGPCESFREANLEMGEKEDILQGPTIFKVKDLGGGPIALSVNDNVRKDATL